ncbi:MAG: hypothetical protein KAS32_10570 [Candidatus Peribacteraceae bacterium]|nr:hypothetical protein [Candidatus Peribacteraceae bacterium]
MEYTIKITDSTGKEASLSDISEETLLKLRACSDKILVPDSIEIHKEGDKRFLGNNYNQILHFFEGNYKVWGVGMRIRIKCELVKCNRSDLKAGDVAFRTCSDKPDFTDVSLYCVILSDDEDVFWNKENTKKISWDWKYWYKVVKI